MNKEIQRMERIGRKLKNTFMFRDFDITDFGTFYYLVLWKYKGSEFSCSITIMKEELEKHTYEEIKDECIKLIRNEVLNYEINGRKN